MERFSILFQPKTQSQATSKALGSLPSQNNQVWICFFPKRRDTRLTDSASSQAQLLSRRKFQKALKSIRPTQNKFPKKQHQALRMAHGAKFQFPPHTRGGYFWNIQKRT